MSTITGELPALDLDDEEFADFQGGTVDEDDLEALFGEDDDDVFTLRDR